MYIRACAREYIIYIYIYIYVEYVSGPEWCMLTRRSALMGALGVPTCGVVNKNN